MPSPWNPDQYHRFRDERSQPFHDLLALVRPKPEMRVVDLGCGTGELTRVLHCRLGACEAVGIDNSETMLAETEKFAGDGLRFELADIGTFQAEAAYDLVFSNAALHWLPNHEQLFQRLSAALTAGGQLAVQVPANHDHPSFLVAAQVAGEEPFRTVLGGHVRRSPLLAPEAYALLLDRLGFCEQHVRLQVYAHHLAGREEVVEWVKGTILTDYQRRMPPELFAPFLERYRELLLPQLDDRRPYLFPFKRMLIWAMRRAQKNQLEPQMDTDEHGW